MAVHGSRAEPLKTDPEEHVIDTTLVALTISKVAESLLDVWFASPPKEALAVAVPTAVLAL
jgi:hypothetical protein